jgi:hypothetical protein
MVRVGGGWVDLEKYLVEYIGKRRRTGGEDFEILELDYSSGNFGGAVKRGERSVSSLGVYSSPPTGGGRSSSLGVRGSPPGGRNSSLGFQTTGLGVRSSPPGGRTSSLGIRNVSPAVGERSSSGEVRRSVSPAVGEWNGSGSIGRAGGTRRMFVRRK